MLIRILKPLDDSLDQVLITDESDTVLGALHIDAFQDNGHVKIYSKLFLGESVRVVIMEAPDVD